MAIQSLAGNELKRIDAGTKLSDKTYLSLLNDQRYVLIKIDIPPFLLSKNHQQTANPVIEV